MSKDSAAAAAEAAAPKVKKSVVLSGIIAGNSSVCTVGRTGNDLHYRGYDIVELARQSTFEEVAYLLVYGELPTQSKLKDYMKKLKSLRGLPAQVKTILEHIPAAAHPMDVLRTGCSYLGTVLPEKDLQTQLGAADIIDRLIHLSALCSCTGGITARTATGLRSKQTTKLLPATFCTFSMAKNHLNCMNVPWTSPLFFMLNTNSPRPPLQPELSLVHSQMFIPP